MNSETALISLQGLPRVRFCHLPTALEPLPALSKRLGINLLVKRDDQTGLACGGNKARKLEYVVADALAQGAQSIVTWAGVQSNWCRQLAAAARKAGLKPILVLFRRPGLPAEIDGNVLLDYLFDAEIHMTDLQGRNMMSMAGVLDCLDPILRREREQGRKAYVAPIGASVTEGSMRRPLGALAYVNAFVELATQADAMGCSIDHLVTATSSGSMQAGLMVGANLLQAKTVIHGIAVSDDGPTLRSLIDRIALEVAAKEFRDDLSIDMKDTIVHDQYIGEGYGLTNQETVEAMVTAASSDGLLLDPVYTGKAMRGLIDLAQKGTFQPGEVVVFLHTGGLPALFPYREQIRQFQAGSPILCARSAVQAGE